MRSDDVNYFSSLTFNVRPTALCFPLVDHLCKRLLAELWVFQFIANEFFYLIAVKGNRPLL